MQTLAGGSGGKRTYTGRVAAYFPEDGIADILNAFCKAFELPWRYSYDIPDIVRYPYRPPVSWRDI